MYLRKILDQNLFFLKIYHRNFFPAKLPYGGIITSVRWLLKKLRILNQLPADLYFQDGRSCNQSILEKSFQKPCCWVLLFARLIFLCTAFFILPILQKELEAFSRIHQKIFIFFFPAFFIQKIPACLRFQFPIFLQENDF